MPGAYPSAGVAFIVKDSSPLKQGVGGEAVCVQ